jgi:hypothetical protein
MKKLLLAAFTALIGNLNAQNKLLIGGNLGFNTSTNTVNSIPNSDFKSNQFFFKPTVAYVFTKHYLAGVKLGISTSKDTFPANATVASVDSYQKSNSFSYGVFGRYTMPLSDFFAAYVDLDLFTSNGKTTTPVYSGGSVSYKVSKTSGYGISLTPNLQINFNNYFALNFNIGNLGYSHSEVKSIGNRANQFGFQFGKGAVLGISKKFNF